MNDKERLTEISGKINRKKKITNEEFQVLVRNTNWKNYEERVVWGLNEPMCCCQSCYDSWLEWGKEVYKNNPETYEERRMEALKHLENKRGSRRLNEESRLCSIA